MRVPACCVASGGGTYTKKIALGYNSSASFENCTSKGFGALAVLVGAYFGKSICILLFGVPLLPLLGL